MREDLSVGERVRILDTDGYILNKKQRVGTVLGFYGRLVDVAVDNYGDSLHFSPNVLIIKKPTTKTRIKLLGIPVITVIKEVE